MQNDLYNAGMEHRFNVKDKTGKWPTLYDQMKAMKEIRAEDPEWQK